MTPDAEDYWSQARRFTTARIGLGRSGLAVPTRALLDFQLAFARARDAVQSEIDYEALSKEGSLGNCLHVRSEAVDRPTYLLRPDLGRRLSAESARRLERLRSDEGFDVAFVIGDGLSAGAANRYAPELINQCRAELADFSIAPIVVASHARVALADRIAMLLNARLAVMLLGERPGLTTAESLGIYLTWRPTLETQDSGRNCISNVHEEGLSCRAAANMTIWLIREAARLGLSGIKLKENVVKRGGDALTISSSIPALADSKAQ